MVELEGSPWWPPLVDAVNEAIGSGCRLEELFAPLDTSAFDDRAQALMWRAQQHLTPPPPEPDDEPPHPDEIPPAGLHLIDWNTATDLDNDLQRAAELRELTDPDTRQLELDQAFAAADRWAASPHTPERLIHINELTTAFYTSHFSTSWAAPYLQDRLGQDLTDDARFRPGYAPPGWTTLTSHLRGCGITDQEMLASGVATLTKNGQLIDHFRDRLILPMITDGVVRGFVGRRNPNRANPQAGPKYLNTATTPLFSKRDILYGQDLLTEGVTPVITEGPLDAIAITIAGLARYAGVAPLGTNLTPEQALLLAGYADPILATDADTAGTLAAENAYWALTVHRLDPQRAALPPATDPADILQTEGPAGLYVALRRSRPQANHMTEERQAAMDSAEALRQQIEILAARPAHHWVEIDRLPTKPTEDSMLVKRQLLSSGTRWTNTPHHASELAREQTRQLRQRLVRTPTPPARTGIPENEKCAARLATSRTTSRTPDR